MRRLQGDNQVLEVDQYPLPNPEELYAALANGTLFSKQNLSQAYLEVQLDKSSTPFVTINTHLRALPACASSIWSRFRTRNVPTAHRHCTEGDPRYRLWHRRHPSHRNYPERPPAKPGRGASMSWKARIQAQNREMHIFSRVSAVSGPSDWLWRHQSSTQQGWSHYQFTSANQCASTSILSRFVKLLREVHHNLSSIIHPLNTLLQANHSWKWTQECVKAFQKAKDELTSVKVLVHYDFTLPIIIAAEASAYGIGAVLSHIFPDGSEKPNAFAFRTLIQSERNYAQLEKEALFLSFGVKKFYRYLYRRKFKLVTDHKPLTAILVPKKGIPSLAAARLQRWEILLSAYDYEVTFKPAQIDCNADGLSSLPLPAEDSAPKPEEVSFFNVTQVQALPVTFQQIRSATRRDRVLSKFATYARTGWPEKVPEVLKPYHLWQYEFGVESGCLMWGIRIIVPKSLQRCVLESLHKAHPAATRMKAVARSYLWWSGLDKDIEDPAKACLACQEQKSSPALAPLHPWIWPTAHGRECMSTSLAPFSTKCFS